MDLKDKIVSLALVALISLVGFNLKETWSMKEEVFKLQQGQKYQLQNQKLLSKQIKKNSNIMKKNNNIVKRSIKKKNNNKKKKND